MRRTINSLQIQTLGMLRILSEICCWCNLENIEQDIIAFDGLTACLEAMERHDSKPKVHAYGCLLIGNLWAYVDARKKVVDEGGLEAVVETMDENEEDTSVQRWGCFVLNAFLSEGIDLVIIAAMNNHHDEAELQRYAVCDFLTSLSNVHAD